MSCARWDVLLLDDVYDLLPPGEREELAAHLATCPRCRDERDALARTLVDVRSLPEGPEPEADPSPLLAAAAAEAVRLRAVRETPWARLRAALGRLVLQPAPVAAGLVAITTAGLTWLLVDPVPRGDETPAFVPAPAAVAGTRAGAADAAPGASDAAAGDRFEPTPIAWAAGPEAEAGLRASAPTGGALVPDGGAADRPAAVAAGARSPASERRPPVEKVGAREEAGPGGSASPLAVVGEEPAPAAPPAVAPRSTRAGTAPGLATAAPSRAGTASEFAPAAPSKAGAAPRGSSSIASKAAAAANPSGTEGGAAFDEPAPLRAMRPEPEVEVADGAREEPLPPPASALRRRADDRDAEVAIATHARDTEEAAREAVEAERLFAAAEQARIGARYDEALGLYLLVAETHPRHRRAPQALLAAVRLRKRGGDLDGARALVARLEEAYGDSAAAETARFLVGDAP